jgi:hypothetical protein
MNADAYQPEKLFTVEQANAALPLVRAIVSDLSKLSRAVAERRSHLSELMVHRDDLDQGSDDPYTSELMQTQRELENDTAQLQEYVRELRDLGVEPKNGPEGLVDFPTEMDGRIVYLCWKLDEPEVLHWHEIDGGFAGRQPLTAGSVAEGRDPGGISSEAVDEAMDDF